MSVAVVGSVAFDSITSPSGSVENILGGAATYFSLAASYFTKVRVVAVVADLPVLPRGSVHPLVHPPRREFSGGSLAGALRHRPRAGFLSRRPR